MPCNSNLCGFQAFLHPFQSICDKSLVLPTLFHPRRASLHLHRGYDGTRPRLPREIRSGKARYYFTAAKWVLWPFQRMPQMKFPEIPTPRFRQSHLTAHSRAHRRRDTHNAIWLAFRGCKLARHSHTYGMAPPLVASVCRTPLVIPFSQLRRTDWQPPPELCEPGHSCERSAPSCASL
jgi:hypothetical protein